MRVKSLSVRCGYTIVELMVTIVVVSVLAVSVGAFVVKLLTLHEQEREEAYIREKLVDICGAYADFLSVGSSISAQTNLSDQAMVVKYRQEAGGVSLETGSVSRVVYLTSTLNTTNRTMDLNVYSRELGELSRKLSRHVNGDAHLLPLLGDIVSCTITPLNAEVLKTDDDPLFAGFQTSDAALGYLQVTAKYQIKNGEGQIEAKTASAGRVVRLWNHE